MIELAYYIGTAFLLIGSVMAVWSTVLSIKNNEAPILGDMYHRDNRVKLAFAAEIIGSIGMIAGIGLAIFESSSVQNAVFYAIHEVSNSSELSRALFIAGAIALACGLFLLRKRARLLYGALEVWVGLIGIIAYPVAPTTTAVANAATAAWLLGFMSLIYIIIRGLDNVDVARTARRERLALSSNSMPKQGPTSASGLASPSTTG